MDIPLAPLINHPGGPVVWYRASPRVFLRGVPDTWEQDRSGKPSCRAVRPAHLVNVIAR
jgi:hypothetical protein